MAYNFFPTGYNPYPLPQNQIMQPQVQQPQQNIQPQQNGIVWVQGIEGAKAHPVAAGQAVLLMDSDANCLYIKSADNAGMPSLRIFDYKERTEASNKPEIVDMSAFATQDDLSYYATKDDLKKAISDLKKDDKKKKVKDDE